MNLGPSELLIILVIALVLFGGQKLPKLARSIGQAQTEFRKGLESTPDDQTAPADDETITLTRAELDALLADERSASTGNPHGR